MLGEVAGILATATVPLASERVAVYEGVYDTLIGMGVGRQVAVAAADDMADALDELAARVADAKIPAQRVLRAYEEITRLCMEANPE